MGQAVLSDPVTRYRVVGCLTLIFVCMCVCGGSPSERKGIGLIFPTLPTEMGGIGDVVPNFIGHYKLVSSSAVTQTNSETLARVPGRVIFSL